MKDSNIFYQNKYKLFVNKVKYNFCLGNKFSLYSNYTKD